MRAERAPAPPFGLSWKVHPYMYLPEGAEEVRSLAAFIAPLSPGRVWVWTRVRPWGWTPLPLMGGKGGTKN